MVHGKCLFCGKTANSAKDQLKGIPDPNQWHEALEEDYIKCPGSNISHQKCYKWHWEHVEAVKAARPSESCNRFGRTRAEHGTIAALQPAAGSTHRTEIDQLTEHSTSEPRHAKRLHVSMGWVFEFKHSPDQLIRPWIPLVPE